MDVGLLNRLNDDRALASEVLFEHRHPQRSPAFHTWMVDLWRCSDEFVLFEAFRGAGKTTKAEEHITLEGCFANFNYGLLIGETYTKACQRLETIDRECRSNERLAEVFGGAVLARKSTENRIYFAHGPMLEAWGWEQELQSFKYHDFRPDFAYLVDIENQERTRDRAAVDWGMHKFWLELVPAMDRTRRRIRFDQTRRAQDCMVTRFASSSDWLYFGMPICTGDPDDPATRSNWEERYPMSFIRAERDRYRAAGMLSEWLMAYMLQAVDPATKPLKNEMFTVWDASPRDWMPKFILYDPARTSKSAPDRTGRHVSNRTGRVVVSRMGSKIIVHESGGHFWKPSEFIADVLASNEAIKPAKIGIEKTSLDDWLVQPLRLEALRRGVSLPLVALEPPRDRSKNDFLMGLQAFGEARDIVLIGGMENHAQLVAEWCNFPSGALDVLNALAYSLRIFAGVPMYEDFSAANIFEAPQPRVGEEVFLAFNGSPIESVCVAVVRDARRLCVAADWSLSGTSNDSIKGLAFEVRATFPRARFQVWCPNDLHDQWQAVPVVPALRAEKLVPFRGEHTAVARGCLSERLRTVWRGNRLLTVDRKATLTLNALSAGYALAIEKGGRTSSEPENGTSRLIAEALESMIASIDRIAEHSVVIPQGANVGYNPAGAAYVTSNPRAR